MKEQFIAHLDHFFQRNLEGITPLQKGIRTRAWDRFLELGLPDKKSPGYHYFPFSKLYQEAFELLPLSSISKSQFLPLIFPECRRSHLFFINGWYVPAFSDTTHLSPQVEILPLKDALNSYGSFLQGRLSRSFKEEKDPFVLLNIALAQMGVFFYVPPKIEIDHPIQCLNIITTDRPALFNPRIHFFLGNHSKIQWISTHHCQKDFDYFSNSVLDIALEEGALFEHYTSLDLGKQGWGLEAIRATLKRDSRFKSISFSLGTKSIRQDFRMNLLGENASCDLKGLSALHGNGQSHIHVLMDHQLPHCQSNQRFKSILNDAARFNFEGKIFVHPKAQKTEAYQLNNNLILSDRAIANSRPNLEIFADDVKASHGATISQLNPEHLHYLKTRGIHPTDAKQLLLSGFCLDILNEVSFIPLREQMEQLVKKACR